MTEKSSLSLKTAILININIMLGIGIFANTVKIAKLSEALSALSYIIIGILMLPLVISMAKLSQLYPDGGFYAYAKNEISTFAGFFSSWGYLIGKLASGAFVTHVSLSLIQKLMPSLGNINIFTIETIVITIFVLLNMLNMKSGGKIQAGFTILKIIPIIFAIFFGLFLFDLSNFSSINRIWEGIPKSLPFLLYATIGFESICVLSNKIENPSKNVSKAILISYFIAISIMTIYQLIFYGALGTILSSITQTPEYLQTFPVFLQKLLPNMPTFALYLKAILHIAIASSALGGSYGIMFSNTWNIHTLAKNNHLFFSKMFTKFNQHGIPFACVILIGFIYLTYLFITGGDQMQLPATASLGIVSAYTLSIISLLIAKIKNPGIKINIFIPIVSIFNCILLMLSCINMLINGGISSLTIFATLMAFGCSMYFFTKKQIKI
ncbi:MAG: Amino acid permease [candidate division TM6 bacterium GW2011_GWF2_30_66]|jgi:amino acid transporter|nr:MAG: Amino acid permease [candidate division TM6 bacterium GW2011_GWF2_30_66]